MGCWSLIRLQSGSFVPCGRCGGCRERYAREWAYRLKQENRISATSHFVTLTYSDDYLVWDNEKPILHYPDFQNYMKRLRKLEGNELIRYYVVGERGSKFDRPHWHAIIFNASELNITKAWRGAGFVDIKEVNDGRIIYLLKYLNKDEDTGKDYVCKMSKGIGSIYLKKANIEYHKKALKSYVVEKGGYKTPMPRYYKDRIFTVAEKRFIGERAQRYYTESMENIDILGLEHKKNQYYLRRKEK